MRRLFSLIGFGLLVLLFALPAAARAHANLLRSEPVANAALDAAPREIRLWFTEPLVPNYSSFEVLDGKGTPVLPASGSVDPAHPDQMAAASLSLAEGAYTVNWRNVSAADGHPSTGSFSFIIGHGQPATGAPGSEPDPLPPLPDVLLKSWGYVFGSILFGGAAFRIFLWATAPTGRQRRADRMLLRLIALGWLGLGIGIGATLVTTTIRFAGSYSWETQTGLLTTRPGLILGGESLCWLLSGVSLLAARRRVRMWYVIPGLGVFYWLCGALLSHAAAVSAPTPAILADWVHLLAVSVWVGGLIALGTVVFTLHGPDAADLRRELIIRFSPIARVCVIALLLTGLYATWIHTGSADALVDTHYGRLLLLKIWLVFDVLVLALCNSVLSALRLRRLGWLVRGLIATEITVMMLVLLVVGGLTTSGEARGVVRAERAQEASQSQVAAYADMQMTASLHVTLGITPGYAGLNTFDVYLNDLSTTAPVSDAERVKVEIIPADVSRGRSTERAEPKNPGRYSFQGADLSIPGRYKVRVTIARPDQYDELVDFAVEVPPAPDTAQDDTAEGSSVAVLIFVLASAAICSFLLGMRRRTLFSADA